MADDLFSVLVAGVADRDDAAGEAKARAADVDAPAIVGHDAVREVLRAGLIASMAGLSAQAEASVGQVGEWMSGLWPGAVAPAEAPAAESAA